MEWQINERSWCSRIFTEKLIFEICYLMLIGRSSNMNEHVTCDVGI